MENNLELKSKIEALLFFKGEPMTVKKISDLLKENIDDVNLAISNLKTNKEDSGLCIVINNNEVTMGTNPKMSGFLEEMRKEELSKDLSKASLETLAIILYKNSSESSSKNAVTRSEIDYIRGVNSSFILRNLLIRGLIQKSIDKNDNRRYIYQPTLETLQFMGITEISQLPNYEETVAKLNQTLLNQEKIENNE